MPDAWKTALKITIAWVVIVAFVIVWWDLGIDLIRFDPTATQKKLPVGNERGAFAGLVSTTVATATATVLGFQIKSDIQLLLLTGWWARFKQLVRIALTPSTLIAVGCIAYLVTGIFIVYAFLTNVDQAPETINAFYLSVVGWFLGGFAAAFKE